MMTRRTNLIAMLALLLPLPAMYLALWIAMVVIYFAAGEAAAQALVSNGPVFHLFRLLFWMFAAGMCLGMLFWFNAMLPSVRRLTGDTDFFRTRVLFTQRVGILWRDSEFRRPDPTAVE